MRIPNLAVMLLVAGVVACGDSAAPAKGLESLRVEGKVLDNTGAPVAGGSVSIGFWYSLDHKEEPSPRGQRQTGTGVDGSFVLLLDGLEGVRIDSVSLRATGTGCSATGVETVIPRAGLPEGPDGVLALTLPGGPARGPAVTAVGQICARGDHPLWGVRDMALALRIDSLNGELVYGRWVVTYRHSAVGPKGRFQGVQRNGILVLALKPDGWNGGSCTELRLAIPVGGAGAWGPAAVLQDDGCLPESDDLIFAPESEIWIRP